MKKLLTTLLSLTLASSLTLGLVACGDKSNGDEGKVTAEQWAAALSKESFASCKVKVVQSQSGLFSLPDGEAKANGTNIETTTYTIAGDRQYSKTEISVTGDKAFVDAWNEFASRYGTTEERYGLKVDDGIYLRYRQFEDDDDDEWTFDVRSYPLFSSLEAMTQIASVYDSFEYNSAKKGYTVKEDADSALVQNLTGTVVKFKNKKLSEVYSERTDVDDGETYTYVQSFTFTYGTYTVNIPATTSEYAGTWETYQFKAMGATLGVGDTIPEGAFGEGSPAMEIKADSVTFTFNNDGTASYKFWEDTGKGAYEDYGGDYFYFYSNDLEEDYDKDQLSFNYADEHLTFRITYKGVDVTVTLAKKAA